MQPATNSTNDISAKTSVSVKTTGVNIPSPCGMECFFRSETANRIFLTAFLFFTFSIFIAPPCTAQTDIAVFSLDGSAKIQHADRRSWGKLSKGDKITDNDIMETSFQSRLVLADPKNNSITLGPSSKMLINITKPYKGGASRLNITLFSGGLLVKSVSGCHSDIFTSNAVGHLDSGTVSIILDERTGQTGFQSLGGNIEIRNISQLEGSILEAGQASVISSGASPTPPQRISNKHMNVLNQFFGVNLIKQEMAASNISVADETSSGEKVSFSSSLDGGQGQPIAYTEPLRYKPPINFGQIYDKMLLIHQQNERCYRQITCPEKPHNHRFELGAGFSFVREDSLAYPGVIIPAAVYFPYFSARIRIPILFDYEKKMSPHFDGIEGILDKIDFINAGSVKDSAYLAIKSINRLTMGNGTVVEDFSNINRYSVLNTIGAVAQFKRYPFNLKGFIADISSFGMGGILLVTEPGPYRFGAGYYWDASQNKRLNAENSQRFFERPDSIEDSISKGGNADAIIYELNAGFELVNDSRVYINFLLDFAQKRSHGNDGFVVKGPGMVMEWKKVRFSTGIQLESGRMMIAQFHPFYTTNRRRIIDGDHAMYQNSQFSTDRRVIGCYLDWGMSPLRGTSLNLKLRQDLNAHDIYEDTTFDSHRLNYTLGLSIAVDSVLAPAAISFGEMYVQQIHGGYFPVDSKFFKSWGFESGLNFISAPFFGGLSLELGGKMYFLDLDKYLAPQLQFNNEIDDGDFVLELYAGLRLGFL
jgi:hypothetical protein